MKDAFDNVGKIYKVLQKQNNYSLNPLKGQVEIIQRTIVDNELVEETIELKMKKINKVKIEKLQET